MGEDIIPPCLVLYFLFFSPVTIPRTPLSSPLPFLVSVWMLLPIWLHVRLTAAILRPFATVLFSKGNAKMFYWLCHREPNIITTTLRAYSVFVTWMWLLTVYWSASLTSQTDSQTKQTYCKLINSRTHLAVALTTLQVGCDSYVWQCSTKKTITKLWENDSQSVDGHTDQSLLHYFPAEYFSA